MMLLPTSSSLRHGRWPVVSSGILALVLAEPLSAQPTVRGPRVRKAGRHVAVELAPAAWNKLDDPTEWLRRLDRAYEAFADLVGRKPFKGTKQRILEVDGDLGAWAVSGQPIQWASRGVGAALDRANQGDIVSGILHEMSHNFDMHRRWVWEPECWAIFKTAYVLEKCRFKVHFKKLWCDYGDPVGKRLEDHFRSVRDKRTKGPVGADRPIEDWYADKESTVYFLLRIKNQIGWEPFKETFRRYQRIDASEIPTDPESKFGFFVHMLSQQAKRDLGTQLRDWGYPIVRPTPYRQSMSAARCARALRADGGFLGGIRVLPAHGERGRPIALKVAVTPTRTTFNGLRTRAGSTLVYDLGGKFHTFAGVACPESRKSMSFRILVDSKLVWDSGPLTRADGGRAFEVSVADARTLELVVQRETAGRRTKAVWADARLVGKSRRVTFLDDLDPVSVSQKFGRFQTARERRKPLTYRLVAAPAVKLHVTVAIAGKSIALRRSREPGTYVGKVVMDTVGTHDAVLRAEAGKCTLVRLFGGAIEVH